MRILIVNYGLGITDVGSEIKNDPEIIALDAQTLKSSLDRSSRHSSLQSRLDRPIVSTLEPYSETSLDWPIFPFDLGVNHSN